MNSNTSDINTRLDDIATRRQDIQERISALQSSLSSSIGEKQCEEIQHLKTVNRYLCRSDSFLRRQNYPSRCQLFNSPLAGATSSESTLSIDHSSDSDSDSIEFNDTSNTDDTNDPNNTNNTDNTEGNDSDSGVIDSIEFDDDPYASDEPDVQTSSSEIELYLWEPDVHVCGTDTLRGAHCGRFGTTNRQSIVAYGPHHLSSWSSFGEYTQTHLTELLPRCTIKRLVPLSPKALGIVADLENASDGRGDSEVLLFDINAALNNIDAVLGDNDLELGDEESNMPLTHIWSKLSSYSKKVSILAEMDILEDRTLFMSGEMNSNEVVLHSFMQDNRDFTYFWSKPLDAQLKSHASALCYDKKYNRALASTNRGQISVVDVSTGKYICGEKLYDRNDLTRGLKMCSLAICPTSPHLTLATCCALTDQIKILDLRMPISAVLTYGKPLISEYPEEIVPTWNPYNGVIVAPFNRQDTG
ncbi:hypothetical protein IW150_005089, partial [Coemansia sp. RSA 2607]